MVLMVGFVSLGETRVSLSNKHCLRRLIAHWMACSTAFSNFSKKGASLVSGRCLGALTFMDTTASQFFFVTFSVSGSSVEVQD